MAIQDKKIKKINMIKERVYKEIAKETLNGPCDLFTLGTKLVKHKFVDSKNKFDLAVECLKNEGRVFVRGKEILVNNDKTKHGTLIIKNNKLCYVVLDGDNHQYGIDFKDTKGFHSNERVIVGFLSINDRDNIPFVIAKENDLNNKKNEKSPKISKNLFSKQKLDEEKLNLVYGVVTKLDHDNLVFIPFDKTRFKKNIIILNSKETWADYQDKICTMEIITNEDGFSPANGFIKEIKGDAKNPIAEYDAIAESHGANMHWSGEDLEQEINNIPTEVNLSQYSLINEDASRMNGSDDNEIVDLRHLQFTTTDPATCKDMDDAIYSTFDKEGNLIVYTAVANVSKYVNLNSEIGQRYIHGAFTTYAPNKAYNILPPQLSTNICSLNPNVDRLAFVVKTKVDSITGIPIESKIMDAVIKSHEKYSYEQAQQICDSNPQITSEKLKQKINKGIELSKDEQVVMNSIASDILWKGFKKRGIIEFNTNDEYDIKFSDDMSNIIDIKQQEHIKYHKVIEAFMLTANEASAQFALENGIPNIYRVHDKPNESKTAQAEEFFGYLNIPFDGDFSPMSIKKIISSVKNTSLEKVVNNFLVRMQSKAKYNLTTSPIETRFVPYNDKKTLGAKQNRQKEIEQKNENITMKDVVDLIEDNISHFGLQSLHYSHTTSPIRRITDFVTHYNILAYMKGKQIMSETDVLNICQWANLMQDENDCAELEFKEVSSAIYCESHINEVMKGYICGFKKIMDTKNSTLDNILVLVENEEKGIKVQIPAIELLKNIGVNSKDIVLSQFGTALVNRQSRKPILKLCSPMSFKITQADRVTRQVYASSNLQPENERDYDFKDININESSKDMHDFEKNSRQNQLLNIKNSKDIKIIKRLGCFKYKIMNGNKKFISVINKNIKLLKENYLAKVSQIKQRKGRKVVRELKANVLSPMTEMEAYQFDKSQSIKKRKIIEKHKSKIQYDLIDKEDD